MSAQTDSLIKQLKGFLITDGHGSVVKLGDTGYGLICDQISDAIAELESDIETLHTDLNTIVPQQDKEIEQLKVERDAWKATATQAAEYCMAAGVVCDFCPHDSNNCIGIPCPVVDVQYILTHFGAPEDKHNSRHG